MKSLFFFLLFLSGSIAVAQNVPKISAKEVSHDFGTLTEGEIVTHNFEIFNTGNAELKIDQVRASCGCTDAKPEKKILKPGEKTFIKVEFNSTGRIGPQEKFVYIFSNDPKMRELKLSINCVIVEKSISFQKNLKLPKLKLLQSQYDFGNVEEGKTVDVKISFKNEGNSVLKINDVKTSCGCTAALLSNKSLQPGETGNIRIELDTANREGKLTRTVTIYTNDPEKASHTITLFVNIEKRK